MKILITGVTGQDGSNMADYLLLNLYKDDPSVIVYGTKRNISSDEESNYVGNIKHLKGNERFILVEMDLSDIISISNVIGPIKPDFCINFAAQSLVSTSWNTPFQTFDINVMGVMRLLEVIKQSCPTCRFYSAGSSEEFGDVSYTPQDIHHPLKPRSPYGASKCAARHIVKVYRESYGMYAVHATLFNHEGRRRGEQFVTMKIAKFFRELRDYFKLNLNLTNECVEQKRLLVPKMGIGNIYAERDWSDSEDFIVAVWKMLNMPKPREYLISSGTSHTVKEFIDLAAKCAKIDIYGQLVWEGKGINEKLYLIINNNSNNKYNIVFIDEKYYRLAEVDCVCGDSTESRKILDWEPTVSFEMLVQKMVDG